MLWDLLDCMDWTGYAIRSIGILLLWAINVFDIIMWLYVQHIFIMHSNVYKFEAHCSFMEYLYSVCTDSAIAIHIICHINTICMPVFMYKQCTLVIVHIKRLLI